MPAPSSIKKRITGPSRAVIAISIIVLCIFWLTQCINKESKPAVIQNAEGEQFAGSASCANCHKAISDSHVHTAHYLTSQVASQKNIKGSFEEGKNSFSYNYERAVTMEKRDDGFYQVEYDNGEEKKAARFDIVVGSGTKGQTYLYWVKNRLFELPITYFTAADRWTNSPGYPNRVIFNRPITSRCLECHSTYIKKTSAAGKEPEEYDHDQVIYGVDCEKCHGPAAKHVAFQTQNPNEKKEDISLIPLRSRASKTSIYAPCAMAEGFRKQNPPLPLPQATPYRIILLMTPLPKMRPI